MIEEQRSNDVGGAAGATGGTSTEDDGSVLKGTTPQDQSDAHNKELVISPDDQYKSNAMVKFSQVSPVSQFSRLKLHTDLRRPPENWLRSGTQCPVHNTWLKGATTQFSSFNMAESLPRTVGEVDVISASENIKKLLKIPFSKAQVSMAVHRIGRTLLLDELDLYQHLRTATKHQRNWLKDVIYRTMEDERNLSTLRKTNETLQHWNLLSKFLHYSIGDSAEDTSIPAHREPSSTTPYRDTSLAVQHVPDPPQEPKDSEFARHVLWEFEDLRMLIGSDLPIFGGGKYPAVSLRLRDMDSPINVLTGMDYWLDNLMCNVPEIAMCYHLDGIVKKYELLQTEEIPHLENAKFSPRVVIDIAQNILSFIKSSCTKEGHTYWLYKGQNDDVVKLYDLTSLSMEPHNRSQDNPFVEPVALLLYRVAHTMSSSKPSKKDKGIICKLLKNCLSLLEREGNGNPELSASANCLLSHMLVSDEDLRQAATDRERSEESDDNSSDTSDDNEEEEENVSRLTTMKVDRLMLSNEDKGQGSSEIKAVIPKIFWDTKVERAKAALAHIVKGLMCIENYTSDTTDDSDHEPEALVGSPNRQLCYPQTDGDKAHSGASLTEIVQYRNPTSPLRRTSSDDNERGEQRKGSGDASSSLSPPQEMSVAQMVHPPGSWQHRSKTMLMRKARQIYSILAIGAVDARKYGQGIHYAKLALSCHYAFLVLQKSSETPDNPNPLSEILQACGDCQLLLTHNASDFVHHQEDYEDESEDDIYILQNTRRASSSVEYNWAIALNEGVEAGLRNSIQCYMEALSLAKDYPNNYLVVVGRKLGNAYNEQGVFYRNGALELDKEDEEMPSAMEQELWKKSYQSFESGILAFEEVNDAANVALLHCNLGQLMRVCAHAYAAYGGSGESAGEFTQQEKHYYNKGIDYYQKALGKLEQRQRNKVLWDSVSWELSTTFFTMATLLQDHPPLSRMAHEQVEKEVLELMTKALSPCEMEGISPGRQPIYQYRAATIHHRLASMYHNSYRNQLSQQKQKHTRALADLHYDKAIKLFQDLDHPTELLRVQLEKVALYEHIYQGQSGVGSRIKSLQSALNELLQCQATVVALNKTTVEETINDSVEKEKSQDAVFVADRKTSKGKVNRMKGKCNDANAEKTNIEEAGINLKGQGSNETLHCKVHQNVQLQHTKMQNASSSNSPEVTHNTTVSSSPGGSTQTTGIRHEIKGQRSCANDATTTDNTAGAAQKGPGDEEASGTKTGRGVRSSSIGAQSPPTHPSKSSSENVTSSKDMEEKNRLQGILRSRLQFVLLNLIKLHSGTKKGSLRLSSLKKMYALALSQPSSSEASCNLATAASSAKGNPATASSATNGNLGDILQQIKAINK